MKFRLPVTVLVAAGLLAGCSQMGQTGKPAETVSRLVPAEGAIPGVPPEVEYADFWIRKAENPDAVIMSHEQIEEFNRNNPMSGTYIMDLLGLPEELDGAEYGNYLKSQARRILDAKYFVTGDIPLEQADRKRIVALMDTMAVPEIVTSRFGMMLRREYGKIWPTTIPLMGGPDDNEFDMNMVTAVDMGEPVVLIHTSRDGRWSFVQHSLYTCWMPSDAIAFGTRETVAMLRDKENIVVATGHRVSVYGDPSVSAAIGSFQMGSYFPIAAVGNEYMAVQIPGRGSNGELIARQGYVRRDSNISIDFLPYTLRNVYRQIFLPYGHRYGWGGMYEERDCSNYVLDVYRSFGIILPRNSSKQAEASRAVITLDGMNRPTRMQVLNSSPGGITILRLPGHVMIYLGDVNGKPYMAHDFWAWRTPAEDGGPDITHRAARIAVTDFLLGEGSKRGAFIDRLSHVTILADYVIEQP